MLRRAKQTVYWPGLEGDLQYHRSFCDTCNTHAPSQPPEPLLLMPPPEYPFQQMVVDMFQVEGHIHLAYADRLTGRLGIAHFPSGTSSYKIMAQLRCYFTRWGTPEQIFMNGGTNLVSEIMMEFFRKWRVAVRLSSPQYPQSNGRAEVAVKTAKRVLRNNTEDNGSLDDDKVSLALLQYLNTPLCGVDKPPEQLATGQQLHDGVPTAKQNFKIDRHWRQTLRRRELQMVQDHEEVLRQRGGVIRHRCPLVLGSRVQVQNQITKAWDRLGTVIEAL
ncbi:uncharacterized protein K02A2.6-like [Homarus americanus]|uniref:uncharacterized protein K02A2.6-like n=1 Tax=Homarus americanus TaxID=6706 RepID=UPI001C45F80F|nr:uncharacterized protein K02A2.6-like [Homarus americanus]